MQVFTSEDINWWTGVVWIILIFLSAVWISVVTYQHFCILYRYHWKSTVLGTIFDTKAKHKNMLIKKHTIFINKVKQNTI